MAYLSAPLWFLFLIAATALIAVHTLVVPQYFVQPFQLFPLWPQWHPEMAATLFGATALLLFLPKVLASLLIEARGYGGRLRLALSVLVECAVSALLAPVRMLFHTQFVVASLLGRAVRWKSPPRADAQTGWGHAVRRHGLHTLIGMAWIALVWWLDPSYVPWLLPVAGALMLSIPLSVYSSRVGLGQALRRRGLFLIPEETEPVPVLEAMQRHLREARPPSDVLAAVVDPAVNALTCAFGVARRLNASGRLQRRRLVQHALRDGLGALTPAERKMLIVDPVALSMLHFAVGSDPIPLPPSVDVSRTAASAPEAPTLPRHAAVPAPGMPAPATVPLRHTGA
jgi:membrane glycosyltransferase